MTMPGGGGDRLEVQVVADASGFARDAQAKIDAEVREVKARIQTEIDARRLSAQLAIAVRQADTLNKIQVKVGVDNTAFQASLRAAVAEANARNYAVKVRVEVDRSQLAQAASAAQGAGSTITHRVETVGGGEQQVTVTADTTRAEAKMDALRAREKAKPIDVPIELQQEGGGSGGSKGRSVAGRGIIGGGAGLIGNLTKNLSGMEKFGAITGIIQGVSGAVDALGGGLLSMAGAASQAVGVLAALPNLAGVAAQGIGSLMLGFSGITKAVGLASQQQASAGQTARASASAQISAEQAVANARQNVANVARTSAEQIASAEHGVEVSQRNSLQAQQALTQARKDATQTLADYKNQLADAALSEESAGIAIERARENWNKTMRSSTSTALDRKESDLALRQAEQNLTDIQAHNAQLKTEAADANNKGVEGAANVVAAKQNVVDTTYAQAQAEQQLRDTQITTAQQTASAQQQLANAIRSLNDLMAKQSAGASALAAALAKLSPAGREFVRFIQDEVKPKFEDLRNSVQGALLPPVERGVRAALPLLDTLKSKMTDSASIMGTFVENIGRTMGTPLFRGQVASIMDSNNRALGKFTDAAQHMLDVLMNVGVAVEPIVERFATWIDKLATRADDASSNTDRLAGFFQRASDRAAQLGDIIGNIAGALFGLGKGGTSAGGELLDSLQKVTQHWSDWANSVEGQAKIKEYMDKLVPVVKTIGDLLKDVVKIFVAMGDHQGTLKVILDIFDGIAKFLSMPLVGPFVAGLMALAGVATILSTFIKRLTKIKDLFDTIKGAAGKVGDKVDSVKAAGDRVSDKADRSRGTTSSDRQAASDKADDKVRQRNQTPARVTTTESPQQRLDRVREEATGRTSRTTRARRAGAGAIAGTVGALGTAMSGYGGENADDVTTPASRAASRVESTQSAARTRTRRTRSTASSDLSDLTDTIVADTGARLRGEEPASTRQPGRLRRAGSAVAGRFRQINADPERGSMRLDFGLTGDDEEKPGAGGTKKGGRVKGAARKAGGAAKKAGGAVGTVKGLAGGRSNSGPATAVNSAGQEVGGLGGQIGGFAEKVQAATAKASQYVGGWAGDALKKVSTFSGGAGKMVADWSSQGVGKAVSTAGGYVKEFASGNGDTLKKWAGSAKTAVMDMGKGAGEAIKGIGPKLGTAVKAVKDFELGQKLAAAAGKIWAGVQLVLNAVLDANPIGLIIIAIGLLVAGFVWAWTHIDGFKQFFVGVWNTIKGAVSAVIDWVKEHWPLLLAIITGPIGLIVLFIVDHWDQIKHATEVVFNKIRDIAVGIWDAVKEGFRTGINWVIGMLNGLLHGANKLIDGINSINPFGDIPHIPDIPKLADGSIVTKATLAVIGEAGDELVLPLAPNKAARRDELLRQAGLLPAGNSSLSSLVAGNASSRQATAGGSHVGTVIAEGAIQQTIINPKPETPGETLNSRMRRLADLGIFGQTPAGA